MANVAVGFASHAGWAIAVTVGVVDGTMEVHDRRRVDLVAPTLPRQPYHAAVEVDPDEASQLVATVENSILTYSAAALDEIGAAVTDHALVATGIVGDVRVIPDVATVLASHALMHATEGEQYRAGLGEAARRHGMNVVRTDPARLDAEVTAAIGWSSSELANQQSQVRSLIGPPWQKDHKHAAAVALIALHATT